jgi:hypothetical protein
MKKASTSKTSIIVNKDVHDRLKIYCNDLNQKIGGFVEKLITDFLNTNSK